jgi:hypothetical protein
MYIITAWTLFVLLVIGIAGASSDSLLVVNEDHYIASDDATWAVMTPKLSRPIRQKDYNTFMNDCRKSAGSLAHQHCDRDEAYRLQMNMYQPRSVCLLSLMVESYETQKWKRL